MSRLPSVLLLFLLIQLNEYIGAFFALLLSDRLATCKLSDNYFGKGYVFFLLARRLDLFGLDTGQREFLPADDQLRAIAVDAVLGGLFF